MTAAYKLWTTDFAVVHVLSLTVKVASQVPCSSADPVEAAV